METAPRLLRTLDAARYCGFSKSTFEKWRCVGGGPPFIRRGSAVYYDSQNLDDWLASLPRYRSTSEADIASEAEADT